MSDTWEYWLGDGDAYGRNTRLQLQQARAEEARARSRLENQLRSQTGNLQGQLDRLTDAFIAFVEYEDIRGELNEHVDSAAVRKYARSIVPNIVVTGGTGLGDVPTPPEVPTYWLSWTVRGLVAATSPSTAGGDGAAELARARACDTRRTALLLVLIDAIRREQRFGIDDLDAVLPDSADLTRADRALWVAVTDGRLGPAAVPTLEARLRSLLGTPDPAVVDAWVRGLAPEQKGTPVPVRAAATLAALLRRLDRTGVYVPDAPADAGSEDPLAEMLRALVDEGAPDEAEILVRMTDVRARMGFVEGRPTGDRWDAPAGSTLLGLLLADLADEAAPAARHDLAARLLAPALATVVETLRAEGADTAFEARTLHTSGMLVTIGADGAPDAGWRGRLEEKIRKESPIPPGLRPGGYVALVVGVVGLALVVISPGWLALAAIGLLAGGAMLLHERQLTKAKATSRGHRLTRADTDVAEAGAEVVRQREQVLAASAQAEQTAATLATLLSTTSAPTPKHASLG